MPDQIDKRRAGNPAWTSGKSGNPRGRPRAGLALAERIRERLDPDKILDLAERLADDDSVPLKDRLAALLQVAALGYAKPASDVNVTATALVGAGSAGSFAHLSPDQLRAEIARVRGLLAAPSTDEDA